MEEVIWQMGALVWWTGVVDWCVLRVHGGVFPVQFDERRYDQMLEYNGHPNIPLDPSVTKTQHHQQQTPSPPPSSPTSPPPKLL